MVYMVDHLNCMVISKCCGNTCAFEKESLVVEEEMRHFSVSQEVL